MSVKIYCLFMFIVLIKLSKQQQNTTIVSDKSEIINGIVYTSKTAPQNQLENIVYYDNGLALYKGLTLKNGSNLTATKDTYRIIFKLQVIDEYLNELLNEKHVNGSKARVDLLNFVSNKLNISENDVKLDILDSEQVYDANNQTDNNLKLVNLVITHININGSELCKAYLSDHKTHLINQSSSSGVNKYNQLFETHSSIKQIIKIHFDSYCSASIYDDFLLAVIVPSAIIGSMLLISVLLACILHRSNKKRKQKYAGLSSSKPNQQIYKQKSYISKGVPVILYEEMAEKANEEEDYDSNGGHRLPLILRNEKPPVPPPEYRKLSTDNNNNEQQALNEIQNMINSAPLAIAEQSDDTIAFLSGNNKDDAAYYQPPQPIATLKDVSRRSNLTTSNSNSINISNSYLNNNNSTNNQQKLQP